MADPKKLSMSHVTDFIKETRNELILLKEFVNSDNHYESQGMEAFKKLESLQNLFQGLYEDLNKGAIPESWMKEEEKESGTGE